jgi:pimeloyl-ACP methyl ester carboxylesterase
MTATTDFNLSTEAKEPLIVDHTLKPVFERHTAKIKGGIQYIDEGNGIPVLFVHGALSNANTWRKVIPILSQNYRCIAIDLPLGGNYLAVADYVDLTPIGIAMLLNEFLEYLAINEIIVVSNDTGGAYVQIFASLFPEKVSKLVFSNCEVLAVFPPAKFAYLKYAVRVPGFTFLLSRVFSLKFLLKKDLIMGLLSLKVTDEELSNLYLNNFISDKGVRANFASAAKAWSPKYTIEAARKLRTFEKPVLILWGNQDFKLFPLKLGENLKAVFPNAKLVEIANARTYIQEDQPDHTIEEIVQFIDYR